MAQTIELLKTAAQEWRAGKMSGEMFAEIAYGILFPSFVNAQEQWDLEAILHKKKDQRD